jgi:hypothetical protein
MNRCHGTLATFSRRLIFSKNFGRRKFKTETIIFRGGAGEEFRARGLKTETGGITHINVKKVTENFKERL